MGPGERPMKHNGFLLLRVLVWFVRLVANCVVALIPSALLMYFRPHVSPVIMLCAQVLAR